MEKMGIRDTQYIIGRHYDKEHPHVHIAFNRVDNNGRTISDKNDRYRSERICKELTRKAHREGVRLHYGQCQHLLLSMENIIDHISL